MAPCAIFQDHFTGGPKPAGSSVDLIEPQIFANLPVGDLLMIAFLLIDLVGDVGIAHDPTHGPLGEFILA